MFVADGVALPVRVPPDQQVACAHVLRGGMVCNSGLDSIKAKEEDEKYGVGSWVQGARV